jgi:hypothetical protein
MNHVQSDAGRLVAAGSAAGPFTDATVAAPHGGRDAADLSK